MQSDVLHKLYYIVNVIFNKMYNFNTIFRFREDEVRAEMGEREVQKLQKEVDKLEVNYQFLLLIFSSYFY